jgi:GxxExxY protein
MHENDITAQIVDAAVEIHRTLGPGLFESVYESILAYELERRGLTVERQKALPVVYKSNHMGIGFRLDLLVESRVIVEVKSIEALAPVHTRQLITYLRLANIRVGLLLNFSVNLMRDGIKRVVDRFEE